MKRTLKIIIVGLSIIVFCVVMVHTVFYSYLFLNHFNILKTKDANAEYYSNYFVEKDGFILKTKVIESDDITSVSFMVYSSDENSLVFDSYNEENHYIWRLIDFGGIEFAEDSLDIIVKSGDEGTFHFLFDENNWYLEEI